MRVCCERKGSYQFEKMEGKGSLSSTLYIERSLQMTLKSVEMDISTERERESQDIKVTRSNEKSGSRKITSSDKQEEHQL